MKKSALIAVIIYSFLFGGHPIAIDGNFNDWETVPLAFEDSRGDVSLGMVDFADFKITYDNDFLFIYFSLYSEEMLLQNNNSISIYIDGDNDSLTGGNLGEELVWHFGNRNGSHYIMDGITAIYQSDISLRMAPTITSQEFEIAISLTSDALTSENSTGLVQGKLRFDAGIPNTDHIPFVSFFIGEDYISPPESISFDKRNSTDIRLVTHNVWSSNLMNSEYQEYFERIYSALNPDIVVLQEMYENTNQLQNLFNSWFPNEQWYVSNQFRDNIIISKYPVLAQNFMTSSERTMVALLNTESDLGRNLIIFSSHLACCDNDESRQYDTDEFVSVWREWRINGNGPFTLVENTPFIHVGDFNLVGDRQQLVTLTEGDIVNETTFGNDFVLDWDGTGIIDLFSRHTHKRMGYTWRNDGSSFSPGKLDYILYTDSVLDTAKHFVFNTMTMDSVSLSESGLEIMDSYYSSDHSPRVLDIAVEKDISIQSEHQIPSEITFFPPYPNPFNPQGNIRFELKVKQYIIISIYNINGQLIKVIHEGMMNASKYSMPIVGSQLSNGIYFIRVQTENFNQSYKIVLLK